jgi:hypothetical protein
MPTASLERRIRDQEKPLSTSQAYRLDVEDLHKHRLVLDCRSCGRRWANVPGPDGDFPSGFWRCPSCKW